MKLGIFRVEFVPKDLWIGIYWESRPLYFEFWLCLLPTLPIHIVLWKSAVIKFKATIPKPEEVTPDMPKQIGRHTFSGDITTTKGRIWYSDWRKNIVKG